MKLLGMITALALSLNALAIDVGSYECKNTKEKTTVTLTLANLNIDSFSATVMLDGMEDNAQAQVDFTYTGKDVKSAGAGVRFLKPGVSDSEIRIDEVADGVYVGSLTAAYSKYHSNFSTTLLTCTKK